jgi:homoserine kinase type II
VNEGKTEADVRYEGAFLWHLGVQRFPTPQPLRTSSGEAFAAVPVAGHERLITVFPWTPGEEAQDGAIAPGHAGHLGEVLARLHLAGRGFGQRLDGIYTFERIAARVEGLRARAADLPAIVAEVLPVLDEEIAFLRAERPRGAALPVGNIHGDVFPDNVLWEGERIVAVLDFEQASRGRLAYDLAVTLLAWCWEAPGRLSLPLGWALASGYQKVRPLDDEERARTWVEARTAALRFAVTRITDIFLPSLGTAGGEGRVEPRPGKDFRDYVARIQHLRAIGPEGLAPMLDERPPLRAV